MAEYFVAHYSTVSRAVKRIKGKSESDIARPDPPYYFANKIFRV